MKNWVDRYVYAVGEKISKKQREDIIEELRSAILDAIDERVEEKTKQTGRPYEATEEDIFEVLETFGAPSQIAKQYMPNHKYLIGPELMDLYKLVMTIALIAVGIGITIASVVSVLEDSGTIYPFIYKLPGEILGGLISTVGSVTIVFAIIQYITGENQMKELNLNKTWRAKDLDAIPFPHNRIKRSEMIVAIGFGILGLIIVNLFPDKIAFYQLGEGEYVRIPLFNLDILRHYMLLLNCLWILQISHYAYNLKKGQWTVISRLIDITLSISILVAVLFVASDPEILNIQVNAFKLPKDIDVFNSMTDLIGKLFKVTMVIAILATLYESSKHVYYMLKK